MPKYVLPEINPLEHSGIEGRDEGDVGAWLVAVFFALSVTVFALAVWAIS